MIEKMNIQVEQGIGYIGEFNGVLQIGVKDRFLPMIEWIEQNVKINIKSVGKRYAPNNEIYKRLNQDSSTKEIFNFFDHEQVYSYLLNAIRTYMQNRKYYQTKNYSSFISTSSFQNYVRDEEREVNSIDRSKILLFIDEIILQIEKERKALKQDIDNATTYLDDLEFDTSSKITPEMINDVQNDIMELNRNFDELKRLESIVCNNYIDLYKKSVLFLFGEALIGKTHLFCDVALNRLGSRKPTLLFFGNQFNSSKTIIENIVSILGLNSINDDEFLEALDKLSKECNAKTLIMIDALNETENPKIWQDGIIKFCEQIKSYPNLALAVSIRDVEKNKVFTANNEDYLANEIVEIEHKGFEGIELAAVRTFCEALGIEFPKVPLHTYRLFVNPGMLFLYIESIKNSTKKVDTSIINPLTVFKSYVDDLERKYYQKYMNEIDEDDELVSEAIKEFISLGTQKDYLHFYLNYKEVKEKLKPLHKKILEFLISEGVLNKLKQDNRTKVYFTYQKFENFFIADYLLGDFEQNKEKIFTLIREHHGAVSEALFMQIPEILGKEVFDLNIWFIRDIYICEQYLQSLVWRRPSTINDNTFKYINFIQGYEDLSSVFLDMVLQLSSIPSHPLNIVRLHKKLLKSNMSERDYHWSIYLHYSYVDDGIVKRIIDWAWNKKEEFEIDNESLHLYGLTLGWFFASSNRELRDGATKALVNLFTDNVDVYVRVLKEFESVDDLYVLERLYAVGYGIVLRSSKVDGFRDLGEYIYQTIFDTRDVIEHILIRDYAKLAIEYIDKTTNIGIDIEKIYPPYNQSMDWELPTIGKEHLEQYQNDYSSIYWSVLYGDFKKYVVYRKLNHFMNLKIKDRPHPKSQKQRYDEFFDALTSEQKDEYEKTKLQPHERLSIVNQDSFDDAEEALKQENVEAKTENLILQTQRDLRAFKKMLSPQQLQEYNEFIVNYKSSGRYEKGIDVKSAKRYIFLETIKMGWSKEIFEKFDREIGSYSRKEHTVERIGKKYQWIAFYKVLAKLTDHYEFREESYSEYIGEYKGVYQLSFTRNIDPSSILQRKKNIDDIWWIKISESFENTTISDREWMGSIDKLPTIEGCVSVKKDDEEFLVQSLSFSVDGNKNGKTYRNLYYQLDSFLIQKKSLEGFIEWLNTVDYFGQDKLPQSSSLHDMYLREYPNGEAFKYFDKYYYGQMDWDDSFDHIEGAMPTKILLTSTSYMNEASSYDKSLKEAIEIKLPNKWFIQEMNLRQTLNDGEWIDKDGNVVFLDPTVQTGGITSYSDNGILASNKKLLSEFLESHGLTQVWLMWGEKQVRSTKNTYDDKEFLGFGEITGYGYFDGDEFIEEINIRYEK